MNEQVRILIVGDNLLAQGVFSLLFEKLPGAGRVVPIQVHEIPIYATVKRGLVVILAGLNPQDEQLAILNLGFNPRNLVISICLDCDLLKVIHMQESPASFTVLSKIVESRLIVNTATDYSVPAWDLFPVSSTMEVEQ